MKVAINCCYGGFSLSKQALEVLRKLKNNPELYEHDVSRDDPDLIQVIETTPNPGGRYAELVIVEIPDGVSWYIEEYDGLEHVAETHRTWP